jgi:UDP-N-acetylglucosamine 2-epimerase (non-hydrolysing)
MKILSVVGARPNFMKIAPFVRAIEQYNKRINIPPSGGTKGGDSSDWTNGVAPSGGTKGGDSSEWTNGVTASGVTKGGVSHVLVHTGQHYDDRMSKAFFEELNIPEADINLGVGSGTHAEQVGQTMIAFEKVLKDEKPDWVVVVGDVNATLACSVTAKKECIKCCHIEAGLRSGDLTMPEEINRLVTDRLSDLLLAPDKLSIQNLRAEGVPDSSIRFVGNIMIDTLEINRSMAEKRDLNLIIHRNLINEADGMRHAARGNFNPDRTPHTTHRTPQEGFAVLTLHRPSNVDSAETFKPIVEFLLNDVAGSMVLLWPVHPRARKQLVGFGLWDRVVQNENIILLEPLGYLDMLKLNMEARVVLTDSGGLQEECTVLGTPCITLRWNTERPVTLRDHGGASVLVGNNIEKIRQAFQASLKLPRKPVRPELWDGRTAERCLEAILEYDG